MARAVTRAVVALALALGTMFVGGGDGLLSTSSVHAQKRADPSQRIRKRLAKGKSQFDDLEYRRALRTLAPIPKAAAATQAQRLSALELIAMSHLILGNKRRAREAFQDLLAIDPDYQLRDDTGSPKIRVFFDRVKRAYVPGLRGSGAAELEHAAPKSAVGGRPLEVAVKIGRGADKVKAVVMHTRRRGVLSYDKPRSFLRHRGGWRLRYRAPAASRGYTLEYYIEARDLTGRVIGRIGGPSAPLSLAVSAGRGAAPKRWYRRWWAIAGGVAIGTGAAIWVTSGGGVSDGSLSPGRITLTP